MKVPVSWLREWVADPLDGVELAQRLTLLGLEVESVEAVAPGISGLVVGEVLEVARHPGADRLSLCRVRIGPGEPLHVVCGASNVRAGRRYAVAVEGAMLPSGMRIRRSRIRGELSEGMLCSATELGLESAVDGLLELDASLAVGADAVAALALDDVVLDVSLTPNRGDCFSVRGIAREMAAATGGILGGPPLRAVPAALADLRPLAVADPADCPRLAGRVVRGIDPAAQTPFWLQERLRRAGVRAVHPVVDVTNYVLLELGQPLHAYDLARLRGGISARRGRRGEVLELLDGRSVQLDDTFLVIADDAAPVGLAGIMGGRATAVSAATVDVFLESAFFSPGAIAGRARRLGLQTDAGVRFERGVDPDLQSVALERATRLILDIAGGRAGPCTEAVAPERLPRRPAVALRAARIERVLGAAVPPARTEDILRALGMTVDAQPGGWRVTPPSWRFDIGREEDLIEEIARLHGYDRIPEVTGPGGRGLGTATESRASSAVLRQLLIARGYQEVVTWSFVDPASDTTFGRATPGLALSNPISAELAIMRQSLLPGLLAVARRNLDRQEPRLRIFEVGTCFPVADGRVREESRIAGLLAGARWPEQWSEPARAVDFHDARGDVEALLGPAAGQASTLFEAAHRDGLHPGRTARISRDGRVVGWIGEIHPALARDHGVRAPVMLFELQLEETLARSLPRYRTISRFPTVRRDLAVVVDADVAVADLVTEARAAAREVLRDVLVFDIYAGDKIRSGQKSVAMGLILQDASRTLTEADVDRHTGAVREALATRFKATIRE